MNFISGGKIVSNKKVYNNQGTTGNSYRKNMTNILENNDSLPPIVPPQEVYNYNIDQWTPYSPSRSYGIKRGVVSQQYDKCPEPEGSPSVLGHSTFFFDPVAKTWCNK